MLLEIAIGDAYGAGFEFAPADKIQKFNNLMSYHQHELGIAPGCYTDDTQMSLAIAELLISGKPWTRENLADKFVECFKRDERLGYSKGFFAFLQSVSCGQEFLERIEPRSTRNGAAMRSPPLGYLRDISQLMDMCELQASLTHNTDIGIKSAQAVALVAHFMIYNLGEKRHLKEFVCEHTGFNWRDDRNSPVACCGEETANAILTVLKESKSLSEVLIRSVNFTGDVDTVAAVALGVASKCAEYEKNLPDFLFQDLEAGSYGRDYLIVVSKKLGASGV